MGDLLSNQEVVDALTQLQSWNLSESGKEISKEWKCGDFAEALALVNRIGAIAEQQQHHPDVEFGWGNVKIRLSTHSAGGLTAKDFVLARKIDTLGL